MNTVPGQVREIHRILLDSKLFCTRSGFDNCFFHPTYSMTPFLIISHPTPIHASYTVYYLLLAHNTFLHPLYPLWNKGNCKLKIIKWSKKVFEFWISIITYVRLAIFTYVHQSGLGGNAIFPAPKWNRVLIFYVHIPLIYEHIFYKYFVRHFVG